MAIQKADGYVANGNTGRVGPITAKLWCTEAVTAGQWIALYYSDTTNPAGLAGFSFRLADSDNADATYGTVGVALETTTAAGYVQVQIAGYNASAYTVAAVAAGSFLVVDALAGSVDAFAAEGINFRIVGQCLVDTSATRGEVVIYMHPMFVGNV